MTTARPTTDSADRPDAAGENAELLPASGSDVTSLPPDKPPDTGDERRLLDWLAVMRDDAPVWRDRFGMWHLFRHADVLAVLRDTATFSSDTMSHTPAPAEARRGMLTQLDPPEHRDLRRVVSAAFTPHTVAGLEPRIREVTRRLLDAVDDRPGQRFDLVDALGFPLPVTVIAELLGLPEEDHGRFRDWADRLFSLQVDDPRDPEIQTRVGPVMAEIREYLTTVCRARRAEPRDDLVTDLVRAEVDGLDSGRTCLDDVEAANFSMLLLLAGHITTTLTLGNAVRTFDENPGVWDSLRADPSRIPAAIEEVLRLRSPFTMTGRVTTRDVAIESRGVAGTTIPAGSIVMPWLLSANHDPGVHPDPEVFDPTRGITGGAQLAFGHGVHFCLGAPLARLEARVALEEMTARWTGLSVGSTDPAVLRPYTRGMTGTRRLPVVVG